MGIAWNEAGIVGAQLPEGSAASMEARVARRFPAVATVAMEGAPPFVRSAVARVQALLTGTRDDLTDLPLDLGSISGFTTRLQLYTVPGQVYYHATRKLVLQGADGVVFVADSQARQFDENVESLQDLHVNLAEHGMDARTVPLVLQYNKRDLPAEMLAEVAELQDALNFRGVPDFQADALHGPGVFETLRGISEIVLKRLSATKDKS